MICVYIHWETKIRTRHFNSAFRCGFQAGHYLGPIIPVMTDVIRTTVRCSWLYNCIDSKYDSQLYVCSQLNTAEHAQQIFITQMFRRHGRGHEFTYLNLYFIKISYLRKQACKHLVMLKWWPSAEPRWELSSAPTDHSSGPTNRRVADVIHSLPNFIVVGKRVLSRLIRNEPGDRLII